ncbi:MAG: phospho-N-acetylmuramoyl-pentapeptide-transferase [Clostridia bacterium]|nr:phospho-N-acetylmuramoyl-pentapeptide-transferase [Clostridia bacterium]
MTILEQIGLCAGTVLIAFLATVCLGRWAIPLLHKLKFGQTILDIGPSWHKKKQGTPTMGGLFFIAGMAFACILAVVIAETALGWRVLSGLAPAQTVRLFAGIGLALGCALIGFADDYIKVVKKRNLGLTDKQKLFLQLLVSAGYTVTLYLYGADRVWLPFAGEVSLGVWFIPLGMFLIVGIDNATNLTDGVDGLCGSVTLVSALAFAVVCGFLTLPHYGLAAAALVGAMAGYLVYNVHPARVMMGDTGSLFIGGALCALAFGIGHPLLLIPFGLLYILETLSVILQVSYFKLTHGKRLFKMSPIHHHFELCGWSERKIVTVFAGLELLVSALTVWLCSPLW